MIPRNPDIRTATRATRMRSAAPAGGARIARGRGCIFLISLVMATAPQAQTLAVPSGQDVALHEILLDTDPGALWIWFRFLAPAIARLGGTVSPDLAGPDMDHLCADFAAPYVAQNGLSPDRVVISLSDRALAFGDPDPAATQFFELYRLENARCIWEAF